jgi:hypothetical protein
MKHLILPLAAAAAVAAVAALWAGPARAAEPDTRLPRLPLGYVSAFTGVLAHADVPSIDWSRSNTLVGALQGHAGHWRQPPSTPQGHKPASPPKTDGARP